MRTATYRVTQLVTPGETRQHPPEMVPTITFKGPSRCAALLICDCSSVVLYICTTVVVLGAAGGAQVVTLRSAVHSLRSELILQQLRHHTAHRGDAGIGIRAGYRQWDADLLYRGYTSPLSACDTPMTTMAPRGKASSQQQASLCPAADMTESEEHANAPEGSAFSWLL
eukprot:1188724-Prorocentrum_minimum.AAC.1